MQVPLEHSFRDLTSEETIHAESIIAEQVTKLERLSTDLMACRVAVSKPQRHQHSGNPYRARILLTLPHHELVVSREPGDNDMHTSLSAVLRDAFHALERQLKDTIRRDRHEVKSTPEEVTSGFVVRLFRESGYGFIKTDTGDDLYFHQNSVLHGGFDRLTIGTQVRYEAALGDKGPQATSVQIIDKPGARRQAEGDAESAVPEDWKPRATT